MPFPLKARSRAALDFKQLLQRPALYSLETDIQNIYCTKGSLVALTHDTLRRHYDSARVVSASMSGSNITALTLDSPLRLDLGGDATAAVFDGSADYLYVPFHTSTSGTQKCAYVYLPSGTAAGSNTDTAPMSKIAATSGATSAGLRLAVT